MSNQKIMSGSLISLGVERINPYPPHMVVCSSSSPSPFIFLVVVVVYHVTMDMVCWIKLKKIWTYGNRLSSTHCTIFRIWLDWTRNPRARTSRWISRCHPLKFEINWDCWIVIILLFLKKNSVCTFSMWEHTGCLKKYRKSILYLCLL